MSRLCSSIEVLDDAHRAARRGIVLLLVLVVVTMLALGGYSFARLMTAEAMAAQHHSHRVRARAAADSGVDYTVAILAAQQREGWMEEDLWDNALRFRNVLVSRESRQSPSNPEFRFSVFAPRGDAVNAGRFAIRYGVSDEAARLNVNGWPWIVHLLSIGDAESAAPLRNPLLSLPRMTPEVADAILDWIDPDDQPRPGGAESSYYLSLSPPYRPRNAPLLSLQELLMVRGVTPRMLYGEDANQNGLLDPNENDGGRSYPNDDSDGILDPGWMSFLTIHGRRSDTDRRGQAKIFLNGDDLEALYQSLAADPYIDDELARFVVAYRLFGPIRDEQDDTEDKEEEDSSSERDSDDLDQPQDELDQQTARQPGLVIAGLDASGGAAFSIASLADLIDVSVAATVDGKPQNLDSPFTTSAHRSTDERGSANETNENSATQGTPSDKARADLDHLMDRATTIPGGGSAGRLNVNSAAGEVLRTVPRMSADMVRRILAARALRLGDRRPYAAGFAWLVMDELLTVEEFKAVQPYLTGYSQLYRMQVIGYSGGGKAVSRVRAVVDLSGASPMILSRRELTSLGRGIDLPLVLGR